MGKLFCIFFLSYFLKCYCFFNYDNENKQIYNFDLNKFHLTFEKKTCNENYCEGQIYTLYDFSDNFYYFKMYNFVVKTLSDARILCSRIRLKNIDFDRYRVEYNYLKSWANLIEIKCSGYSYCDITEKIGSPMSIKCFLTNSSCKNTV